MMRTFLKFALPLLAILLAYTAWPFVDLFRLAHAIDNRNVAAVASHIEFRGVRPSLSRQALNAYLKLTGKDSRVSSLTQNLIVSTVTTLADPSLAEAASVDELLKLMAEGWPREKTPRADSQDGRRLFEIAPRDLGGLWRLYANSEYGIGRFEVSVPPHARPAEQFRLGFRLTQWTWKLFDIELPEHVRMRLAEQMLKASEQK